jgi:hypothetical protein
MSIGILHTACPRLKLAANPEIESFNGCQRRCACHVGSSSIRVGGATIRSGELSSNRDPNCNWDAGKGDVGYEDAGSWNAGNWNAGPRRL